VEKGRNFITAVVQKGVAWGWQMNAGGPGEPAAMWFAGSASANYLLLFGARSRAEMAAVFDDLRNLNAEQYEAYRVLLEQARNEDRPRVTRDAEMYNELSRLNNELINRDRELQQRTQAVQRLSEEKSRLMGVVAHDLRNPLTIVAGNAQILAGDETLDEEQRDSANEILTTTRYMIRLVNEILDAAKYEEGAGLQLDRRPVMPGQAVREVIAAYEDRAREKQIEIRSAIAEVGPVMLDPAKIRQIFANLIGNAIKYSAPGTEVRVEVSESKEEICVRVIDQGTGIPQDRLADIFKPFTTIAQSGTAGEKSIGLGLWIVKRLADLHGAKIDVASEVGKGSTFAVRFRK
jgi:signal transduction histidine kinase